jgi:hypothetical protein
MEKIEIFIRKYGLILVIGIAIFCFLKKNKTQENMICDLKRPQYNYFFTDFKHIIQKYDLRDKELKLLKALFDESVFRNNGYNKDNKSLSEFIKSNNLTNRKDDFVGAVFELLNSNRIWESTKDYKVNLDSKVSQLRHIWLIDKLITDLACVLNDKEINLVKSQLKKMFDDTPVRLCNQEELLNYCSAVSANPSIGDLTMDELNDEEESLLKGEMKETYNGKPSKKFKLISVKNNVSKFGKDYYKEPYNSILLNLLEKFEEKYSRKIDNYDRNDLVKLVLIYVPELQKLINKNALTPDSNPNKAKLQKELDINKELFYYLKHHYKVVSIYNLINILIKDPKEKELAYKCCSDINDNSNKCYDFARLQKDSTPIVYGFDKYGYVKDRKCTPELKDELYKLQTKTLEVRLSENKFWNDIEPDVKDKFYSNLKILLNYFTTNNITQDLRKSTIASLIVILKFQNIKMIFPDKLDTVNNNYSSIKDVNVKKSIESIKLASSIVTVMRVANDNELGDNDFNFLSLGSNVDKIKNAAINLIKIKSLLVNYRANKGSVNQTISRMLALIPSDYNYYKIMIKGGILPRFHDVVLEKFFNILSSISLIKLREHSLSKKPADVIEYTESVFPLSKSLDTCKIYKPVLERLRTRRNISPREYLYYKQEINRYCDSRDDLLNRDRPVLYKDVYGKIVETYKRKVIEHKGKPVTVLIVRNKLNQEEIVKLTKDNLVSYISVVINGKKLEHINDPTKAGTLVDTTAVSLVNNEVVKTPVKVKLHEDIKIEEEVLKEEAPHTFVKSVLGKTALETKITDKNNNLVYLINNYFDFEKDV